MSPVLESVKRCCKCSKSALCHAVALERKAWSEPASSGAISDRGRLQARQSCVYPELPIFKAILLSSMPHVKLARFHATAAPRIKHHLSCHLDPDSVLSTLLHGDGMAVVLVQAAESEVAKMKELIRLRGCNEEFIADPALLQEGLVRTLAQR